MERASSLIPNHTNGFPDGAVDAGERAAKALLRRFR
jgi:monoamine oxidase